MRPPNFKKAAKKAVPVLSRVNTATLQPGRLLKLTDDANGWDFPIRNGYEVNSYHNSITKDSLVVFLRQELIFRTKWIYVFLGEHRNTKQPVEVGYEQWVVECLMKEVS